MYKIMLLPDAEKSFHKLDKTTQKRISSKIDWLGENAEKIIHHFLIGLPLDLRGLCSVLSPICQEQNKLEVNAS